MEIREKELLHRKKTSKLDSSLIDLKLKMLKGNKKPKQKSNNLKKYYDVFDSTSESDNMEQAPILYVDKKPSLNKMNQDLDVPNPHDKNKLTAHRSSLKQSSQVKLENEVHLNVESKSVKRKSNVIFEEFLKPNEIQKTLSSQSRNKSGLKSKHSTSQILEKSSKESHEKSVEKSITRSDSDKNVKKIDAKSKRLNFSKKNISTISQIVETQNEIKKSFPKSSAFSRKESFDSDEMKYSHKSISNVKKNYAQDHTPTFFADKSGEHRVSINTRDRSVPTLRRMSRFNKASAKQESSKLSYTPERKKGYLKDTKSTKVKNLKLKHYRDGIDLTMQQQISVVIRKLRYGFTPIKYLVIHTGKTMKNLQYIQLKDEVKYKQKMVHLSIQRDRFEFLGIQSEVNKNDMKNQLFDKLDIFSTNDQELFYTQAEHVAEEYEKNSSSDPTYIENVHNSKYTLYNKSQIKIDDLMFAFKHIIKGYVSPRTRKMMKNKKLDNKRISKLNIEKVHLITTQSNRLIENLESPERVLMHVDTQQFIEDNSLYSEELVDPIEIIADDNLRDAEESLMFKLNYGVQKSVPSNFQSRKIDTHIDLNEIDQFQFKSERKIFSKDFSGVMPKMMMDHIKRPDKALLKQYLKSDRYSSSNRESPSDPYKNVSSGNLLRVGTNKGSWLSIEFAKDLNELDSKFKDYWKTQTDNKLLSKANIPNYNKITQFKLKKCKKKKLLRFAFNSGSYRIVQGHEWKRFRFIPPELYKLIQRDIIYDYHRIFSDEVINHLTNPNKPWESWSIIKNSNKYRLAIMKTVGRSILPEFWRSIGNITEWLFSPQWKDMFDNPHKKKYRSLRKSMIHQMKRNEFITKIQKESQIHLPNLAYFDDNADNSVSSASSSGSLQRSNSVSKIQESSHNIFDNSSKQIDMSSKLIDKSQIIRKSTIRNFEQFDGTSMNDHTLTNFKSDKYKLDITRHVVPIMLDELIDEIQELQKDEDPKVAEDVINENHSSKTSQEVFIEDESLYSQFYYKNIIFMDEEFDNHLFEVYEPELDQEKVEKRQKMMFAPKAHSLRGIEHILLSNKSLVKSIIDSEDNEELRNNITRLKDYHNILGSKLRSPTKQTVLHQSMKLNDSAEIKLNKYKFMKVSKNDKEGISHKINEYKVINKPEDMIGNIQSDQWSGSSQQNEEIDDKSEESDQQFGYEVEKALFPKESEASINRQIAEKELLKLFKRRASRFSSLKSSNINAVPKTATLNIKKIG